MCLYPVHWKIGWIKQNAIIKEFLSLSRFLTERQQSRPLSRVRSTLNTQDIFKDKTQTVTCSDVSVLLSLLICPWNTFWNKNSQARPRPRNSAFTRLERVLAKWAFFKQCSALAPPRTSSVRVNCPAKVWPTSPVWWICLMIIFMTSLLLITRTGFL